MIIASIHPEKPVEGPAGSAQIQIRKMQENDLNIVEQIEQSCFPEPWPVTIFRENLHRSPVVCNWVAENEERIVGFLIAWYIPRYVKEAGEIHIHNIAVDPLYWRQGIGKRLLYTATTEGIQRNCDVLILEVRESNTGAQSFYRRYGFTRVGSRQSYYGTEDALVMEASTQNILQLLKQ